MLEIDTDAAADLMCSHIQWRKHMAHKHARQRAVDRFSANDDEIEQLGQFPA